MDNQPPAPAPPAWFGAAVDIVVVIGFVVLACLHEISGREAMMSLLGIVGLRTNPRAVVDAWKKRNGTGPTIPPGAVSGVLMALPFIEIITGVIARRRDS